jgi:hypothetical protein
VSEETKEENFGFLIWYVHSLEVFTPILHSKKNQKSKILFTSIKEFRAQGKPLLPALKDRKVEMENDILLAQPPRSRNLFGNL